MRIILALAGYGDFYFINEGGTVGIKKTAI